MLTGLFVVARIVTNPVSNVFQKQLAQRGANPIFVIAATHGLLTLVAIPLVAGTRWFDLDAAFWTNMAVCTVLAVAGNALLVAALKRSDLSVLGPVNAYKAVLSLGLGVFLLGEIPTVFGALGVFLILAGSYFVVDRIPGQPHRNAFTLFLRDRGRLPQAGHPARHTADHVPLLVHPRPARGRSRRRPAPPRNGRQATATARPPLADVSL